MFFNINLSFSLTLLINKWSVTDSLPAIALGMDPKDPNNMKEKPRDPKEGIFANGGMFQTIFYGAVITLAVLVAYLIPALLVGQTGLSIQAVKSFYVLNQAEYHQAQVMAFTTLALSELFHMLGMSNAHRSFVRIFKNFHYLISKKN